MRNFLALQTLGDENAAQALRALRSRLGTHGEPDARALAAGLGILRAVDLRDDLPRIAHPALVIAGERRPIDAAAGRPRTGDGGCRAARFHLIERAGHAPFLSHPDEVLAEVVPFLERLKGEPSPDLRSTSPASGRGVGPSPASGRGVGPRPQAGEVSSPRPRRRERARAAMRQHRREG